MKTMKHEVLLFGKGPIMKRIILNLMLFNSVFLVGCAENMKLYSGPKLPKNEVAYIVSGGSPSLIYLTTLHVDGKQIIPDPNSRKLKSIEMLPGLHEIEAKMILTSCWGATSCNASKKEFPHSIRVTFNAEAGKKYVIAAALLWDEKYSKKTQHPNNVFHVLTNQMLGTKSGKYMWRMFLTLKEFSMWIEEWKKYDFAEVVAGKGPEWRVIRGKEKISSPKTKIMC